MAEKLDIKEKAQRALEWNFGEKLHYEEITFIEDILEMSSYRPTARYGIIIRCVTDIAQNYYENFLKSKNFVDLSNPPVAIRQEVILSEDIDNTEMDNTGCTELSEVNSEVNKH
jgi:hypothetical protein